MSDALLFPEEFVWGAATAAPQIEGAAFTDGKGHSIWDDYARVPGKVAGGDTLDVACDHYHRYEEDFDQLVRLGLKHYRMSIAWPRIIPNGVGPINQRGLDYYHKLFRALKARGVTPWVTLFHWDLPQELEAAGGWRVRTTVDAFAHYAETLVKEFHDVVKHWITLNEIRCFTLYAYGGGTMAPGASESKGTVNQTIHHALLCHGHAVTAVRKYGGVGAEVGLTDNPDISVPVSETSVDIRAAREWFKQRNACILEPVLTGKYSEEYMLRCGPDAPRVEAGDMEIIGQRTDFLGLNLYTGHFVQAGGDDNFEQLSLPQQYPRTASTWLNWMPQVMYWGPRFVTELYGVKRILVTENGCGYEDQPDEKRAINDLHRREFMRTYLAELRRSISDGIPVKGYFAWSLLDNFEWCDGYSRRFGLVFVDFATQERIPKLSAGWYRRVVAGNCLV